MHMQGHSNGSDKFCHYFNNDKNCPFEKIGCMVLHQDPEVCYFRVKCRNKLCQFKHIKGKELEEKPKDDLNGNFDKLTDMEQSESKEVFCDRFCNRGYDCHRYSEESN